MESQESILDNPWYTRRLVNLICLKMLIVLKYNLNVTEIYLPCKLHTIYPWLYMYSSCFCSFASYCWMPADFILWISRCQWNNTENIIKGITLISMRPTQNICLYSDDIFNSIFLNENISLKSVSMGPINNIPALVPIVTWRRSGDKSLSEPMMVSLLTHICVTWHQRLNAIKNSRHNHSKTKHSKSMSAQTYLTLTDCSKAVRESPELQNHFESYLVVRFILKMHEITSQIFLR